MTLILLNWVYIFFTSFGLGFLFKKLVSRKFKYEIKSAGMIVFAGLIIATIYAQLFSLVYKVGLLANIVLAAAALFTVIKWHGEILSFVKILFTNMGTIRRLLLLFLTVAWCYCTSRGYIHYDSDLYHAQSIRWIEEYGIVKGLGNIHVRLAYNSSFFALQALYGMKFILGDSLHAVNGFIALLLGIEAAKLIEIKKTGQIRPSDFARLGAFYYLTVIYSDIISPATDYTIMCIIFYLVIKWLVLLENKEKSPVPYSLVCVALCYGVTVKLTAGVILILVIKPAYMLIHDKRWKQTMAFILMGIVTIMPWIIRNVVISGYILYPFPALDIFNVDWKIPASSAASDAAEIKTWGRGLYDASLVDLKISEWFPNWFKTTLPSTGKVFIILDIICIAVFTVLVLISIIRKLKLFDELIVLGACISSYVFWQTQAPLLRYGYAYVLLTIVLTVSVIWENILKKLPPKTNAFMTGTAFAVILLFAALKGVSFAAYVYSNFEQPYYIAQKPYGVYELDSYEQSGVTFYYPKEGDRVGYDKFPAIPVKKDIVFRGEDISEGFKSGNE